MLFYKRYYNINVVRGFFRFEYILKNDGNDIYVNII